MTEAPALHLAEIADSPGPLPERAQAMLHELRRHVPFDASWMAMADPVSAGYISLASTGLDQPTLEYLSGPKMAHDIVVTGTNRDRPPMRPSDPPHPPAALLTWAECLIPAGYNEGLGAALFCPPGRHVGFLTVLCGSPKPPTEAVRHRLGRLSPILARGGHPVPARLT